MSLLLMYVVSGNTPVNCSLCLYSGLTHVSVEFFCYFLGAIFSGAVFSH